MAASRWRQPWRGVAISGGVSRNQRKMAARNEKSGGNGVIWRIMWLAIDENENNGVVFSNGENGGVAYQLIMANNNQWRVWRNVPASAGEMKLVKRNRRKWRGGVANSANQQNSAAAAAAWLAWRGVMS
jgi:hypothetical protein